MNTKFESNQILNQITKIDYKNKQFFEKIFTSIGNRIIDLLLFTPTKVIFRNFIDRKINDNDLNKFGSIDLQIISYEPTYFKKKPLIINCKNKFNQFFKIIYFNVNQFFFKKIFLIGKIYRVTGNLTLQNNFYQIIHPESFLEISKLNNFIECQPVYNISRLKINKKKFDELVKKNLEFFKTVELPAEWISNDFFSEKSWLSFKESIISLHSPPKKNSDKSYNQIRKRLAYDEILSNFLILSILRKSNRKHKSSNVLNRNNMSNEVIKNLPFKLTEQQKNIYIEISKNLSNKIRMFRLLQGDVGSGKTIISLLAISDAVDSGFQAVLLVPTEILAQQHFDYFSKILKPFEINIKKISSKTNLNEKKRIYKDLESNQINIIIGTHSLFNKDVKFKNLGLIVIDEQHKFGVNQRMKLLNKAIDSHVLIMSATPIPRSLALAIYGEIEISVLKQKPSAQKPIITNIINKNKINELIKGMKRKIENDEKIFWVMPEIGMNDNDNKKSIISRHSFLEQFFPGLVTCIHGKMKKNELNERVLKFRKNDFKILVSTTVIEVGFDIQEAGLIVIEDANKFGLAQLHQLRGRVGRGKIKSNCILIHTENISESGIKRLSIMKNSNDGFFIAEQDLNMRGAGEIFGKKQTGLPQWKFFDPYLDLDIVNDARHNSKQMMKNIEVYKDQINLLVNMFFKKEEVKNYFVG